MQLSSEWLALEQELGYRPLINGSVETIRNGYDALCKSLAEESPAPDSSVQTRDEYVTGDLLVRIYTPEAVTEKTSLPIGVYAHGGGFVAGSVSAFFEDQNCRYIAKKAPCIIVSVDFRLAPEHPVPAQLDDYLLAYNWAWTNAVALGGSRSSVFSIGASVGGGLAISVALKLIAQGLSERIAGVVALAPSTLHPDYVPERFKGAFNSYKENADGPLINREAMYVFYGHNGATKQMRNPDVFPALHPCVSLLPPTYIATCGADPVRDDGMIIKNMLDEAGIRNKLKNYEGLPHFFWIYPSIKTGDNFRADSAAAVRFILGDRGYGA